MLLAVDVGNTNIVFALYEGEKMRAQWRAVTQVSRTADEYGVWLGSLLELEGLSFADLDAAIIATVVPAVLMLGYWFVIQVLGGIPALASEAGGVAFWAHVGGFLAGVLYTLVALGFVLIFKASGVFNFAQGAMVLFAALTLVRLMGWVPFWIAFPITCLVMIALAFIIERIVLRPLVNQEGIILFMATIGLSFFIEGMAQLMWGSDVKRLDLGIEDVPMESMMNLFNIVISRFDVTAAAICALLVTGLALFFSRTKVGRALRAVADDHQAALAVGIPLQQIWGIVWAVAFWSWFRNNPRHHAGVNDAELAAIRNRQALLSAEVDLLRALRAATAVVRLSTPGPIRLTPTTAAFLLLASAVGALASASPDLLAPLGVSRKPRMLSRKE